MPCGSRPPEQSIRPQALRLAAIGIAGTGLRSQRGQTVLNLAKLRVQARDGRR